MTVNSASVPAGEGSRDGEDFGTDLSDMVPKLRAFAISLCRNRTLADDLVQETIIKAWTARDRFEPGTNLSAWLHTILRNHFYTLTRNNRRSVEDPDGKMAATLATKPAQDGKLEYRDLARALEQLPDEQREALILTGAGGFSYEEVAEITGCAVGTVKSRIHRARTSLALLIDRNISLTDASNGVPTTETSLSNIK